MKKWHNNSGFSLTEVLLAVGTLAIGMIFVGGTFLTGVYFSTIATERTFAVVAADEAFAKIKLYGVELYSPLWLLSDPTNYCVDFNEVSSVTINPSEFAYPSTETKITDKQYFWSALCRRVGPNPNHLVQVTVFVSRKAGSGTKYRNPLDPISGVVDYPMPVKVGVIGSAGSNELRITESGKENWINDSYTIVKNTTGQIYRVVKRYAEVPTILLNSPWNYPEEDFVWVVPPPVGGGRNPCIAVYQKVIRFYPSPSR